MERSGLSVILLLILTGSGFAAHPQLLLDATELAFIHAKVVHNTADWRDLKATCDALRAYAVQWPDAITGGSSLIRGYVAGSRRSPGLIYTGFNGGGFDRAITDLGVCYQALKSTSRTTADQYAAQAHNIITAMAQPPLTLTRQNDGAIRYAASVDIRGRDLPAGGPVSVFIPHSTPNATGDRTKSISIGEVWSISGATGCTSMNGTWRVSGRDRNVISFTHLNGTPAPALNANCTLFTFDPMRTAYPLRFWIPALAKAYDWFYDDLSRKEKQNLLFCMNAWMYELSVTGLHAGHPENNFVFGNFWALVSAYIATDGDNAAWNSFYVDHIAEKLTGPNQIRDYRQRWMSGGGFGEGWQAYGYNATRGMMDSMLAMKIHGTDWSQPPYSFSFVDDTLRYWMEFTTPSKLALDDNEYAYPIGATEKSVTEPLWIPLSHAVMFSAAARRFQSPLAAQFQNWCRDVSAKLSLAAGKTVPEWTAGVYHSGPVPVDVFLYSDPQADSAEWKTLPLMYRAWSGNYAVTRTDWSDDAVEVTLLGGPTVGSAGNGKTQFNSGSVTVQRGNRHLLVYGLAEAARDGDIINSEKAAQLHHERSSYGNKKNSIFWAGPNPGESRNQGLTSRTPPPGQDSGVTSWPSLIDRAEDSSAYTYWRASGLEANNARSSADGKNHQRSWTRELFFLRPGLVVIHDRTSVLNDGDDRAMFWTFGRSLEPVPAASGMTRYDAVFKGMYGGTFTSVLPAAPSTVTVMDHDNLHFLYRVEVRPAALDHRDDEWLAVIDAADSAKKVKAIRTPAATNADAVQFDDANRTVVAFSHSSTPTLPITISMNGAAEVYLTGLAPSTNYQVTVADATLTIAMDDGMHPFVSTPAGVIRFSRR